MLAAHGLAGTSLLLVPLLAGFGLSGCAPAQVDFTCDEEEPFCDLVAIMNDDRPLATGLDISDVYIYQATEQPLMESLVAAGEPYPPIVAGRYALVRVLFNTHEDFTARELTGRFFLYSDDKPFAAYQVDTHVDGSSSESSLESSFNFLLPGEVIQSDLSWMASIVEADSSSGGTEIEGVNQWPDGYGQPLTVTEGADLIRVMLVPIKYDADGSGRVPDLSEDVVDMYRQYMYAHYPAAEVEVSVGNELSWSQTVSGMDQHAWSALLSAVGDSRSEQGAEDDMYLYGLFEAAASFSDFCAGGCISGLSNLGMSATDAWSRASIGVGYGSSASAETMVHEIGHAHGRSHTDGGCGSTGHDDSYPHKGGYIGVRGYDWRTGKLYESEAYWDFMSYCSPTWVSDYTYDKLHTRVKSVSDHYYTDTTYALGIPPVDYWAAWVMPDGSVTWGRDRALRIPPGGDTRAIELLDGTGRVVAERSAYWSPISDFSGGRLTFAAPADPAVVAVRYQGRVSPLR